MCPLSAGAGWGCATLKAIRGLDCRAGPDHLYLVLSPRSHLLANDPHRLYPSTLRPGSAVLAGSYPHQLRYFDAYSTCLPLRTDSLFQARSPGLGGLTTCRGAIG